MGIDTKSIIIFHLSYIAFNITSQFKSANTKILILHPRAKALGISCLFFLMYLQRTKLYNALDINYQFIYKQKRSKVL